MSEEEKDIQETNEQKTTEKESVEQKTDEKDVEVKNEYDENGVPSTLTKILDKIRGKGKEETSEETESEDSDKETEDSEESEEKDVEEKTEETSESEDEKEEIDPRLVTAARRRGWSNEKIVSLAETNPEVLEDLADLMDTLGKTNAPQKDVKVEKEKPESQVSKIDKFELSEEAISELKEKYGNEAGEEMIDKLLRPLVSSLNDTTEQLNSLRGTLHEKEETQTREEQISIFEATNDIFDKRSEDFPELGKYSDMSVSGELDKNSKAYQVRSQLYDVTMMFYGNGHSLPDSIDSAFRWYKGENAEKVMQKKVVKDLKDRTKKFSPKPSHKKVKETYKTPEDEGVAIVEAAKKKAGIT